MNLPAVIVVSAAPARALRRWAAGVRDRHQARAAWVAGADLQGWPAELAEITPDRRIRQRRRHG